MSSIELIKDILPLLDILLVWYVYMLDIDMYMASCGKRQKIVLNLSAVPFPLMAIFECIDIYTL